MSDKLINADKLIVALESMQSKRTHATIENIIYNLRIAPAVDAVEVVRCCRCCFTINKKEHGEIVTYCALDCGMRGVLDPNDFCSYGERREEK